MDARRKAWSQVQNDPEALQLYQEDKRINMQNVQTLNLTQDFKDKDKINNAQNLLLPYR